MLLGLGPSHAMGDDVRPYVGVRVGQQLVVDTDIAPGLGASTLHRLYGVSLGLDAGRHLGFELAADFFEPDLRASARFRPGQLGSVGELGTTVLMPQVRLRYPVLDDRFVPYVIGGVGLSFTEFNDRKRDGFGRSIHARDTALAWAVGVGLEYLVASNIALGGEVRYAGLGGHDIEVDGVTREADLDSVLVAAGARVYLRDGPSAAFDAGAPRRAAFLTLRMGGARLVNTTIARGIEARQDNNDLVPGMEGVLGFAVGVDLGPRLALEVVGEGYEVNLARPGIGTISEYAVVSFTPQLRVRYPMLGGRLLPSVVLGAGFSFAEFNDRKPRAEGVTIRARDFSPAGVFGAGLEYLVARNLGVGLDVRYLVSRGHRIAIDADAVRVNLDTVTVSMGLRLRFP